MLFHSQILMSISVKKRRRRGGSLFCQVDMENLTLIQHSLGKEVEVSCIRYFGKKAAPNRLEVPNGRFPKALLLILVESSWNWIVASIFCIQEEAGLTRTFETSHVGGATCRTSPIPRSALEKNPMTDPSSKATLCKYQSPSLMSSCWSQSTIQVQAISVQTSVWQPSKYLKTITVSAFSLSIYKLFIVAKPSSSSLHPPKALYSVSIPLKPW